MKVLVTGTAGFVGHNIAMHLCSKNYDVVGVDNVCEFSNYALKLKRLSDAGIDIDNKNESDLIQSSKYKNYWFCKTDIENIEEIRNLFKEKQFDFVCHFAALTGVRKSKDNPFDYIRANVEAFTALLEVVKDFRIKKLIFASSSSVYGLNNKFPFSVNDSTDHPISLYAATKKMGELLAHTYSYQYKIPITGFRFFTIYGPWCRPDMAVHIFTKKIIDGETVNIYGNGENLRDYTYVDDVVKMIDEYLINSEINFSENSEKEKFNLYNIGTSNPSSVLNLIKIIEKLSGKIAKVNLLNEQPEDVPNTFADISNFPVEIKSKADTALQNGMQKYFEWYKRECNTHS